MNDVPLVFAKFRVSGLPLERHASVLSRQPLGPAVVLKHVLQHMLRTLAADVMRLIAVFIEGGIYLDTDVIVLQEIRHLVNSVSCESPQGLGTFTCEPCQAVVSFEAGHQRLSEWMVDVALLLDSNTTTTTSSSSSNSSSSSSSSRIWRSLLWFCRRRSSSIWSWEGRSKKTLREMMLANAAAERHYRDRINNKGDSSSEDLAFIRMLLLPWGSIGTRPLQFMLNMWSTERLPNLDARLSPPSLHEAVMQHKNQQQQQQQQVAGSPWPGLTRIAGEGPPPSPAALQQHLLQSRALQEVRKQNRLQPQQEKGEQQQQHGVWGMSSLRHLGNQLYGLHGIAIDAASVFTSSTPAVSLSAEHLSIAAADKGTVSSLTLYGPLPFFPLSYAGWAPDRRSVTDVIFWGPQEAPEGLAYWRDVIRTGQVYTLHLYSTMIHMQWGDFAAAIEKAETAAMGLIQRSYCSLLCGHKRLKIFGGPESSREISNELVEMAKAWLREVYLP